LTTVALLLAAGVGERLGNDEPKSFVELAGRPMLVYSLEAMVASGVIDRVILVAPPGHLARGTSLLAEWDEARADHHHALSLEIEAVVAGGGTRQESVRMGLEAISADDDIVVCHDAARPLASPELYRRVLEGIADADGCIPVVPSTDTVKRIDDGRVVDTLPRDQLGLAQTPQAFRADALRSAHRRAVGRDLVATDDAMLLEAEGLAVAVVGGELSNFKITSPEDLLRVERFLDDLVTGVIGLGRLEEASRPSWLDPEGVARSAAGSGPQDGDDEGGAA
jgi:2-C-methyl-D-erythritol 4-phosphate cytidylyltransferase